VIKAEGAQHLLDRLGLDHEVFPSGCCGMAGSFGFEAGEQSEQCTGRRTMHVAEAVAGWDGHDIMPTKLTVSRLR
jgi:Fe-S oxidoreductase